MKREQTCLVPMTNDPTVYAVIDVGDASLVLQKRWSVEKRKYTSYATTAWRDGNGKTVNCRLHRFITGNIPGTIIDHRDRNGMNCTRDNLRFVTKSQNALNSFHGRTDKGIRYREKNGKFEVYIVVNKIYHYLGLHQSFSEAVKVRNEASIRLHGEFARLIHA